MQSTDAVLWARDYSAREYTPNDLDQYERQFPSERPIQALGRYIGYPSNPKCISHYPGAYRAHWDSGRPVFLFHQIGYSDMGTGYDGGRAHAQTALNDARSAAVGWDGEAPIVACLDRFYAKAGYATLTRDDVRAYMLGYRSVLGYDLSGFYGFFDSMAHAVAENWASFLVQCGARSAHVPGISAWQENNYQPLVLGSQTDIIEIYKDPFGGTMSIENVKEGFKQLLNAYQEGTEEGKWFGYVLGRILLDAEVDVVDNRQLVPDTKDPKKLVPVQWKDSVEHVLVGADRHSAWAEKNTDDLIKRAVEELDEAELAKQLKEQGVNLGGISMGDLKGVLVDVLGRVSLNVQVPGAPTPVTTADTKG